MVPVAGKWNSSGISMTMSGLICQPLGNSRGAGLSLASPSGAPLSAHAVRTPISSWLSRRSLAKWPYCGSANHGGIFCASTAAFMAFAQGRASEYVSRDIGATSPGRWHSWQFFCNTGRTSLLNVTGLDAANAVIPTKHAASEVRIIIVFEPL